MGALTTLTNFMLELDAMSKAGKSLKEIRVYTYNQRESGRAVPYFSEYMGNDGNKELSWAPIKKQTELMALYDEKMDGSKRLPKYEVRVTSIGVVFNSRAKVNGNIESIDLLKYPQQ